MNEYYSQKTNVSSTSSTAPDSKPKLSVNSINDSLTNITSNDTQLYARPLVLGDYCAAYINKSWVRCKILSISYKTAFVECVDDGRQQHLKLSSLETLDPKFRLLPKFAIKCKLAQLNDSIKLLALDLNLINKFKALISQENTELIAEIIESKKDEYENHIFEVELYINDKNIIQMLTK